jgi:hypothetical protein
MKKYFPGLTALVCAIAFSAFTKPYVNYTFKLLTDPQSANIVNDQAQWSTAGSYFGNCIIVPPVDIACKITLNTSQSAYFHSEGSDQVLNTFLYAYNELIEQDYLEITETTGKEVSPGVFDRIILAIQPKHFNTVTNQYENVSLGTDLSFDNRKD